jgi:hypothetical protein
MSGWSESVYPIPTKGDTAKFKEFFAAKYKAKRFQKKVDSSDSDSDSSEDEKAARKRRKAKKESKKAKKPKRKSSDSDDSEEEVKKEKKSKKTKKVESDSGESEEEKPKKKSKLSKPTGSKLRKGFSNQPDEPAAPPSRNQPEVAKKEATLQPAQPPPSFENLLDFTSPAPSQV